MKQSHKTLLLWVTLILVFVMVYNLFTEGDGKSTETDLTAVAALLNDKNEASSIKSITAHTLTGDTSAKYVVEFNNGNKKHFRAPYPGELERKVLEAKEKFGSEVSALTYKTEQTQASSFWQNLLISWLPMLFLLFVFFFFMKQLQASGGKAMSFGKSKARLMTENQNKVTFKDVAGVDEAKDEVEEIIDFLKDPKKFTRLGGRIPKGVLMMGPPGTGKTLLARAIAGEAGVPFFSISGSDFVEMFVGVGASRVRDLFEQGKKNAPCIIFIDEIDAVGRQRGAGLGGGHDEREQTLNQLLVEMDGFESNDGVILVAATNRPDVLDPALLRPGRFDRRIVVPRPDLGGRHGILKVHVRKVPVGDKVDLEVIARGTPGFSGADLENLVNESALIAARKNKDIVEMVDFEDAKDKVLMGTERRSAIISDKEKKTTAFHEAGHALVALLVGEQADPLHKVTIIPRGRALGLTQQLPVEDRLSLTRVFALNRIAIMMGGRAAEELVFNQRTTGAGNDIEQATDLARRMVKEWGMSDAIGPLNFSSGGGEVFLGREMSSGGEAYSQETAQKIDAEVRRIAVEQYDRALDLLKKNRAGLDAVAEGLLEYETLAGEEIKTLLAGGSIERPTPRTKRNSKPVKTAESPGLGLPEPEPV